MKAHVEIDATEKADLIAKEASPSLVANTITEGGITAIWQNTHRRETKVDSFGKGRVIGWNRTSVIAYSHVRTGKERLKGWREKIGKEDSGFCHCRAGTTETDTHVAFRCIQGEKWGRRWSTWKQMDQK